MKAILTLFGLALLVLGLVACGGGESGTPPVPTTATPTSPSRPTLEPMAQAEDQIREVLDKVAKASSQEDWSAVYEQYAPSVQETCPKDKFLVRQDMAVESAISLAGKEAWEALKEELADGLDIQSIEVVGSQATVVHLEAEQPTTLVREEGQWWLYDEDPCGFSEPD